MGRLKRLALRILFPSLNVLSRCEGLVPHDAQSLLDPKSVPLRGPTTYHATANGVVHRTMSVMLNRVRCCQIVVLMLLAPLLAGLVGCHARVGPKAISPDRFNYSAALTRSWKEEMLLNMVKIRYLEPPLFLNVQQVVQQYTLAGSASIFGPGWTGNSTITQAGSATGTWAESPTITYQPLSGEQLTKSLLQPVSPADLFSLVEAGWPIDAIFGTGVRAINGLHAGSRAGSFKRPGDPDFYLVLSLLTDLRDADSLGFRVEKTKESANTTILIHAEHDQEPMRSKAKKVRELLHLDPDAQEFQLVFAAEQQNDKEIAMLTRPMLEILAEASAGVEIPPSDIAEGRVLKMDLSGGAEEQGPKFIVHVHSSNSKPDANEVYTAVQYRNLWFWIDDRDVPSKRGFGFLMLLFTFVESGTPAALPVLTISKP